MGSTEEQVAAGCKRLNSQFGKPASHTFLRKYYAPRDEEGGFQGPVESDEGSTGDARTAAPPPSSPDSAEKGLAAAQDSASGPTVPPPCIPASHVTTKKSCPAVGGDGVGGNSERYDGNGLIPDDLNPTPIPRLELHPVLLYESEKPKQEEDHPTDRHKDVMARRVSSGNVHTSGSVPARRSPSSSPSSSSLPPPDLATFAAGVDLEPVADLANEVLLLRDCNHAYHTQCLATWFHMGHSSCPVCRALFWDETLQFELGFTRDRSSRRSTGPSALGLS